MSEITPTIGRRIWFFPHPSDKSIQRLDDSQPCDAGIVFVWSTGAVNLSVTDHYGNVCKAINVSIIPVGGAVPNEGYAQWMPYQVKADTGRKEREQVEYTSGPISDGGMDPRKPMSSTNRVTVGQIADLMARVEFIVESADRVADRTSTFVHAYLDGKFFLGSGHSACVDPANYDASIGEKIARKNAVALVEQKLWELEGYALYKSLQP